MAMTTKEQAREILLRAVSEIQRLPRFSGQTQVVGSLKRVLNLAVWYK